jgi:hypothetical protein
VVRPVDLVLVHAAEDFIPPLTPEQFLRLPTHRGLADRGR